MDDGLALAARVARREVSALELVDAAIARIERIDGRLNAVVTRDFDRARQRAARPAPGPFAGVPILLKEMAAYPGLPSTMACTALRDAPTAPIPPIVAQLEGAGFVVIGRTNSSELAALPTCEPELFGPTSNPWHPDHDPGGSSGGAAAAVAARLLPIAQGGDSGGSIRIPASACGVFGFKPSRGSVGPAAHDDFGVHHVLTLSVRDSAALWAIRRGEPVAPVAAPERRLRIAVAPDGFMASAPAHPDCRAAVLAAAGLCERLGHAVIEAWPELDHESANRAFLDLAALNMVPVVAAIDARSGRGSLGRWVRGLADAGSALPADARESALAVLREAGAVIAAFQQRADVILTPVLHRPPARTGEFNTALNFAALRRALLEYAPHTPIVNATGQPAMSLPLHWTADGLPIGVQAIGRVGEDRQLFALAAELEAAAPWIDRVPPVHALD